MSECFPDHMSGAPKGQKAFGSLETGVKDSYEPPRGFWKSKPDPLEEQKALLTTKPSFQPSLLLIFTPENCIRQIYQVTGYL